MNSKAAGEGYKIYSLCCANGFMVDFRFSSLIQKVAECVQQPGFSASESVILDLTTTLIQRFPQPAPFYVLHLDNFFTTRKLYERLYELGIGANGTAKLGSGIPKELALLRDLMTRQNHHGDWYNYIVGNVNCITFCDMAATSMMSTVHDPTIEPLLLLDPVRRPGASLKNAVINTVSTDPQACEKRALRKLAVQDDYNRHIGGSDSHTQQNSYYSTANHRHLRV
jgi:Transposase IS4